jgi:cell wall-associated NlpC family hydrolase
MLEKRTGPGIVNAAKSQIGTPYVWGGGGCKGPSKGGYDCSGKFQRHTFLIE